MKKSALRISAGLIVAVSTSVLGSGCGDFGSSGEGSGDGDSATGTGAQGSGGASGATGGVSGSGGGTVVSVECTGENVSACGGDLTGTWNVAESCMVLTGDMDVAITSLGCPTVPVTGMIEVSGSFTANADGSYTDNTTTSGQVSFPLDPSCLTVSSVDVACGDLGSIFEALGWSSAACADTAGQCSCDLSVEQAGGFGAVLPYTETSGFLTTMETSFTAGPGSASYCVDGDVLTLTPEMSGLVGQAVFLREGAVAGTGGAPGSGGMPSSGGGSGGISGTGGAPAVVGDKPCDIYEDAGTPCVAAHSTVRALFSEFSGNLYQVKRADGQYEDIPVLSPGGYADSSVQDAFCSGSSCVMWRLYDQSGHGNFLEAQTPDSTVGGNTGMTAANATAEQVMVGGHPVYSVFTRPNQAYWNDGSQNGMPVGAEPQGIYMVTSGTHYNGACCYNYGNGQLNRLYSGGPMMDSIYFGDSTQWGNGSGPGPWVMADMEDGMLAGGNGDNDENISLPFTFVTAMEKNNGTSTFALKGGDATSPTLTTMWDGPLPAWKSPMEKQGAVLLGAGGDCCLHNNNLSEGTFYEGAIVAGYPSSETDQAIHANIVEAGYGK